MVDEKKPFRLWGICCAHVGTDLNRGQRKSLEQAIHDSELGGDGPSFDWDIAVNLGDLSGSAVVPDDKEDEEVVRAVRHAHKAPP